MISIGIARHGLVDLLAAVRVQGANLAPGVAGDDRVAHPQRPAMDEHRRDGPAADVEPRLDDRPGRLGVGIRLQLELGVGDEQHLLEQVVEVLLLPRGHVRVLRRPAPLLGLEILVHELLAHALRVRIRLVDLVHRDDDRHLGRARVVDRLLRLRLDPVVGGDDEHRDVRHLRAAGAHGGERLVARRVEERDLAVVVLSLVRADVLRDAARLGLDDGRLTDRVEERRLAVIDVPHDRHHRRPGDEILLGVLVLLLELELLGDVLDVDLALDLGGDQPDRLVRERLGDGHHLPEAHHDLDDLRRRDAERLRQILDGDARRDGDRPGRRGTGSRLRPRLGALASLARVLARARCAAVDDDTALSATRRLARADRPVRPVSLRVSL
jgi:hypothetical protein